MTTDADFKWQQARQPLVRELGWCLFSEPLVNALPGASDIPWPCAEDRGAREILAALDRDPRPLKRHLNAGGDGRLGARFEAMWAFFLANHPRYQLLAKNWPIHQTGRTLGALDFLFRDNHLGTIIHAEVAVKFYLYKADRPSPEMARWIGPNPDDTLDIKVRHLTNHQLPLSGREEVCQRLQEAGLPTAERRAVLISGYLFHPLDKTIDTTAPINPRHQRGEWLYEQDLATFLARQPASSWAVAAHKHWLTPAAGNADAATVRYRVAQQLADSGQPQMLCRFDRESRLAGRYFVVPEGWPD